MEANGHIYIRQIHLDSLFANKVQMQIKMTVKKPAQQLAQIKLVLVCLLAL